MLSIQPCPCGSSYSFSKCCELFLSYKEIPKTAEQLMRSRYCAFVTENEAYLLKTWQLNKRPKNVDFDHKTKWLGLKIIQCKAGLTSDTHGWVQFVARYKITGKAERIEELSYFVKEGEQWLYVMAEGKSWDKLS